MSTLIKGFTKEKACEYCRFISGGGEEWRCELGCFKIDDYRTIPKDCPLRDVPAHHEELIDRYALLAAFRQHYCSHCGHGIKCDHCGVPKAIDLIQNAPTIIEAED